MECFETWKPGSLATMELWVIHPLVSSIISFTLRNHHWSPFQTFSGCWTSVSSMVETPLCWVWTCTCYSAKHCILFEWNSLAFLAWEYRKLSVRLGSCNGKGQWMPMNQIAVRFGLYHCDSFVFDPASRGIEPRQALSTRRQPKMKKHIFWCPKIFSHSHTTPALFRKWKNIFQGAKLISITTLM